MFTILQLKSRKLKQAMGRKGAEGAKDDDWLAVDCFDLVVHFMMPSKLHYVILCNIILYFVMSCHIMLAVLCNVCEVCINGF